MSTRFHLPSLEPLRPVAAPDPVAEQAALASAHEAARAQGYAEGLAQARAEVHGEMAAALQALQTAAAEMAARRDALCDAVEPAALALALAGAEQIVAAALEVRPELVVETAKGALRRLTEREKVIVIVAPEDLDHMRAVAPEVVEELGGIEVIEIQSERRLTRGSVIVQTPTGDVDARLDTRLAQLGDVVRDVLTR